MSMGDDRVREALGEKLGTGEIKSSTVQSIPLFDDDMLAEQRRDDVLVLTLVWSMGWLVIAGSLAYATWSLWPAALVFGGWLCSLALASFAEYLVTRCADIWG